MKILGIHGGYNINSHDAAATLIVNGKVICSVEEERLYRQKDAHGLLPIESIQACLNEAKLKMREIDFIAIPRDSVKITKERAKSWLNHHWGYSPKIVTINHQLAHLASAFFHSGMNDAMCLSYDAFGDNLSAALAIADKKKGIKILETRPFSNSLGVFYATMTNFIGFKAGDEFKVMGLAPYGKPNVDLSFFCKKTKEGYFVDHSYFTKQKMNSHFEKYYSLKLINKLGKPRLKNEKIKARHKNLASSTQFHLEQSALSLINYLYKITGKSNLCLAGGVALNCKLNGLINKLPYIKNFFVQPAASDRGLSLGAAMYVSFLKGDNVKRLTHTFYGPSYNKNNIKRDLDISGLKYHKVKNPEKIAAKYLKKGKIIGWFQDRSEFGPRALGHRSILANPSVKNMKDKINKKIKFREEYRPFAPAVLSHKKNELFNINSDNPYMTIAYDVKKNWIKKLSATTHVDGSARVQTVDPVTNSRFFKLINEFYKLTGIPVVLNTSFNTKGQAIVETPRDALSTFAGSGLDMIFINNFLIKKNEKSE